VLPSGALHMLKRKASYLLSTAAVAKASRWQKESCCRGSRRLSEEKMAEVSTSQTCAPPISARTQ